MYMSESGNPRIEKHIAFREYLRIHRKRANDYKKMKLELARQYKETPEKYQEGKGPLSEKIIEEAMEWYSKTRY